MLKIFLSTILSLFEEDLAKVSWAMHIPEARLGLDAYSLIVAFLICRPEQMKFKLNNQYIKAINDGAITLRQRYTARQYQVDVVEDRRRYLKTIVSLEVQFP